MNLYIFFVLMLFEITGCSNISQIDTINEDNEVLVLEQNNNEEAERIAEIYRDIYEDAIETKTLGKLEVTQNIINRLGNNGYVAVDSENQINMTEVEQVLHFCEQVDAKQKARITIIVISYLGGFTKYELNTEDGRVDVIQELYLYKNGQLECVGTNIYLAETWRYTEEGYLIFSGSCYSEDYYILSLSDIELHVALRVEPLDEKCRELNRQYIYPIGYGRNNMFISNWSEDDFRELNFYDLYDIFYQIIYNQFNPYKADENLRVGAIYRISKIEFENVIMAFFNIDSETLQSKTTYFSENEVYEYKPRGFYEAEYPEIPYPEVINYIENDDGTITLTVNAVYSNGNTSKLYSHEVVIRILSDNFFQYVSNQVITPADDGEMWWHIDRLTEEEWKAVYEDE